MMKKSFLLAAALMLTGVLHGEFISKARWLWSEPRKNPPMTAFLRNEFEVKGPVKRAWFYAFWDKRGQIFLNGKPLHVRPWPSLQKYRGHVKGSGLEIGALLKQGKNVLAVRLERNKAGCFGIMLRGEVEYADGRKVPLMSSAEQFKASGTEIAGWNTAAFDASAWLLAWEQGDALMTPWSTYGNTAKIYCTPEEYERYAAGMTAGFPEKQLLKEPADPDCRIVYHGTVPGISVDGRVLPPQILSGVHFMPSPHQDAAIRHTAQAGVSIYKTGFYIEAFYSGSGNYDFSELDLGIRRILAKDPEARIFIGAAGLPPREWMAKNPDELVGYAIKNDRRSAGDFHANVVAPSVASEAYRQETARMLKALGAFVRRQPWGRRVIGLHLAQGGSSDGMLWGCHAMPDTGKRMTEAFRRFLKRKYRTDAALRKAWNDPAVTLDTAQVPDREQRPGSGNYLKNPGDVRDRRVLDYYETYHNEYADYLIAKGKAAKEALPGRLVGSYYGYTILSYEPEGSTAFFEKVLKSPCIDYLWATTRGYNLTDGLPRHLFSVFRRYGKLSMIEGDIRTHKGKGEAEVQWLCRTPEETRATFQKLIGNTFFYGCGYEAPDFGKRKKWFDCPEALGPMAQGIKIWRELFKAPPAQNCDAAVIMDPNQIWKQGHPFYGKTFPFSDALLTFPLQTLNFSGVPYDLMALEDYLESKHPYKAVIFLNQFEITPVQRKALLKKLRRSGVTAIWNYAPGLLAPEGYSDKAMKELTGIDLKYADSPKPFAVKLTDGGTMRLFGLSAAYKESPRVSAHDPKAEVLGRYADDNSGALVRKVLPGGGVSVFAGLPVNEPAVWAALLKKAGCHAYTEPGFLVKRNSRLLMVFSGKNTNIPWESRIMKGRLSQKGEVEVTLPFKAKTVTDRFTGKVICKDAAKFTLKAGEPCTWLMETTPEKR